MEKGGCIRGGYRMWITGCEEVGPGPDPEPGDYATIEQAEEIADAARQQAQIHSDAALDEHETDTIDVHGIADTSQLETQTGAQDKADDAQADAEDTAAAALAAHAADTTNVHGIADTADLLTQAEIDGLATEEELNAHIADTTAVHGIPNTASLETAAGAQAKADGAQAAAATALSAHSTDTTAVHGIADTSALETQAGAQSKADAAEAAAEATAAGALAAHAADTTDVHGITDTADLLTSADLSEYATDAELAAHTADTTAVHGIPDTSVLATDSDIATVQGNLTTHAADTTAVHGIADTSALETASGAQAKVDAHNADTTAVHGIPDTSALLTDADLADYATDADLAAHAADTTAVHGIADTSVLETTTGSQAKADAAQAAAIADAATKYLALTGGTVTGDLTVEGELSANGLTDWVNAATFGATGDGTTDDTEALQDAIDATPPGGVLYLPHGDYRTSVPLYPKPGVTIMMAHSNMMAVAGITDPPCRIRPLAAFTGEAVLIFRDQATGGYAEIPAEHRLVNVMIDGSAFTAANLDGIVAKGNIQNVVMHGVTIRQMSNNGIYTGDNAGIYPYSWRLYRVMLDNNHANGAIFNLMTDLTLFDCQAIGNWGHGYMLNNLANSQLSGCRAEWNGNHGYVITGNWGDGTGSGGMQMSGCSTDRNGYNGVFIDATGTVPIVISNLMTRRDGRNGGAGGAGYAGVKITNATAPVTIGDWTNFPGVDDNGTNTSSPDWGGSFTGTNACIQVDNAYLHAAVGGLEDGGANTILQLGANLTYATGLTSAPVRTAQQNYLKRSSLDWVFPPDYGAVGDGVADDQEAIQAAIDAAPTGGVVYFGAKRYGLGGKLRVPPYVTMLGGQPERVGGGDPTASLVPLAGFTDAMVIELVDQATGGYATLHRDTMFSNITLDGGLLTSESVEGVRATGYVHGVQMHNVSIHKMTGHGINQVADGSGNPYSWYLENVQISAAGAVTTWDGFHFIGTDHQLVGCRALGARGHGYYFSGGANNQLVGCRAEWSAKSGFYLTGSWGTGTGSGGMIMTGCSTDRNSEYGVLIDATGNPPILISGLMARRDGRNGFPGTGGGGFAAVRGSNATVPILIDGVDCYPGIGDDGLGTNSPERGVSFGGCTWVSVNNAYLHAATTAFHDDGTNTVLLRGPNIGTATGTTAAPVRSGVESWNWRGTASIANATDIPGVASVNTLAGGNTNPHYSAASVTAGSSLMRSSVTGEASGRYEVLANGSQSWGSGAGARDVNLKRQAAALLGTDQSLQSTTGIQVGATATDYGGGVGVIGMKNAATAPTTNPTSGAILYAETGVMKVRQANGTVVTVGTTVGIAGARYVAATNASATEKAKADYLCDGTADDVQIQAAIDAAQTDGGGVVLLSPGSFSLAATLVVNGTLDENNPRTVTLQGCGTQVTELTAAANVNAITISNWAQINLTDMGIFISGSGIGIKSVGVNNAGNTNNVSFWHSSFRNLRINGGFVAADTVWAMELGMPWRSIFENIEVEGCRNGIKIINNATMQNAGDCTFTRFFVEIVGTGGYALYVDSIDGNMNQNTWIDFEAGANSTGCTGIWLGGTAGTASQRFIGNLNLEQFATLVNVANGNSNEFHCNYVTGDAGQAGNKGFVTGTNSYNNVFQSRFYNIAAGDTVQVIEDLNTTSNCPNTFEKIRFENNTGSTVTYTKQNSSVFRDITTFNTGNAMPAGLLQYPLSTVNDPTFTPADHNLIAWTHDPATLRSASNATTSGTVYLLKLKIVSRSTVVSNIHVGIEVGGTTLTAGQNFVGLYDSSGTRLAISADQAANWTTGGAKTIALTAAQTLAVGTYYAAILAVGTTPPQFSMGAGGTLNINVGLTTGTARFLTGPTAQTSLPASITLGSQTSTSGARWAALS